MNRLSTMILLAASVPTAIFATTAGAPIGHAGVPADDPIDSQPAGQGQTCQRCHRSFALNPPGGYVRIDAFHYRPGQKQTIKVTVYGGPSGETPEAQKWGFQLTARRASDLTRRAGTFSLGTYRVRCSDEAGGRDMTATGNPCPSDALEFAGHNPNVVFGGENGMKTFEVEWTAPDSDVGNVVFYAAGNAANNNGNNQGDRIYTDNLEIEAEGRSCPNATRPTFESVVNGASFARDISMNALITLKGRDFASSGTRRLAGRADLRDGFPKELACVAVEVSGQRVPLTYVQQDQINAQVPTLASTGSVPVRVILNPGRPNQLVSDMGNVTIQSFSPAFFTYASNGKNTSAVHQDGTYAMDPAVVQGARAIRPGDVVQLYATGLGPTDPVWQAGEMPNRASGLRDQLTVTIGGTALPASDILYAGVAPTYISGLYQINIRVPAAIAEGDVPITLSIGGVTSPAGTVLTVRRNQ